MDAAAPEAIDLALEGASAELADAATVWVAFSGGLDSTVLLHALARRGTGALRALHINHGLHADADAWEAQCRAQCANLDVPFTARRAEVAAGDAGPEAAARDARYACFREVLGPGDLLLLAHHADDQAETVLLRLLRGAGPAGLAAMPLRRSLGQGTLLRPLLGVERRALAAYGAAHGLTWIEDPSNSDTRFDRNYLRHAVLPHIEQRWPGYRRTFARTAELLRRHEAAADTPRLPSCRSCIGDPGFPVAELPPDPHGAAVAIRGWLAARDLSMPPARRLEAFVGQLLGAAGAQIRTPDWILERYRDAVYCREPLPPPPAAPQPLVPGQTLDVEGVGRVTLDVAADGAELPTACELRFRGGGERLRCADGTHLRLKNLYQSAGVPPWWRDRVPLLYGDDALLAVGTLRRAAGPAAAAVGLRWEPQVGLE